MAYFSKKTPARILGNKTVILIGVVILVFLSVALGKELLRRYEVNQEIAQLEEEIAQLEERNLDLDDLIDYFNTNSFAEREARQKLGMQKEGETTVIFPESDQSTNQQSDGDSVDSVDKNLSNPMRWWNYFFNKT
jgi:cell division protein FtsB